MRLPIEQPLHAWNAETETTNHLSSLGLLLLAMVIGVVPAMGQDATLKGNPPKQNRPELAGTDGETELEPGRLAEGSYADRQKATLEMWRRRGLSRQAVQDAARDSDPEVAERAAWILKQWRSGAVPGADERRKLLKVPAARAGASPSATSNASAIASVMEEGLFDAALIAVEESAGTIEYGQTIKRIERALIERFPIYVDRALRVGTEPELLRLLDAVASDRQLVQASFDLRKQLGLPVGSLPDSTDKWDDKQRQTMFVQLALIAQDQSTALQHAAESGDSDVLRLTRMICGRWDLVARDALEDIKTWGAVEDQQLSAEQVDTLCWALTACSRSGDEDSVGGIVDRLVGLVPPDAGNPAGASPNEFRWRTLAVHHYVNEAIDILAESDMLAATKVACAASRFDRAFEICGHQPEDIDTKLDLWIQQAYRAQAESPVNTMAPEIERLYALARILLYCGNATDARHIYEELDSSLLVVDKNEFSLRDRTLFEIYTINRLEWLIELAVDQDQNRIGQNAYWVLSHAIPGGFDSIRALMERIKVIMPRSTFQERFQATCHLLIGKLPIGFNPETDFDRLYQALVRNPTINRSGGRLEQVNVVALQMGLVRMFQRHEQVALARKGLELLASRGNIEALLELAESGLKNGEQVQSGALWEQVLERSSEYSPSTAIVTVDHGVNYTKAIVGKWIAAKRSGHHRAAEQLERRLRLILTSPSLKLRYEIASYLREVGKYELATGLFRDLVILTTFAEGESPDFYDVATGYAGSIRDLDESDPASLLRLEIDPSEISRWNDLAVVGILSQSNIVDSYYISVPLTVRKVHLEQTIKERDDEASRKLVAQIESLDPMDIDYAERILPKLRESGQAELADAALGRLMERGKQHLRRHGLDAMMLNNLAWTAAMNERGLEEALVLSQRAVDLEPASVVYRDTLAELLHLLGETQQAVAIESACLLDDPEEWHLYEQIKKYQDALGDQ